MNSTHIQHLILKPHLSGPVLTGASLTASYLKHLGVALLSTDVQRGSPPAVGGVHLGSKVHQILHNKVLIGSHRHLKGTLWTFRRREKKMFLKQVILMIYEPTLRLRGKTHIEKKEEKKTPHRKPY